MRWTKICAWTAVLVLVPLLAITVLSFPCMRALTSAGLDRQTATDSRIPDEQISRIMDRLDLLAEDYGYSPERIRSLIRREDLQELNRELSAWWTGIVTGGTVGEVPKWQGDGLEEALLEEDLTADPAETAEMIRNTVQDVVLPVRETLLITGIGYISRRVDLPNVIRFAEKAPLFSLALSMLAAGMIALLLGNHIRSSLKYYGTAAAGAGITVITAAVLARLMDLRGTIRQAAEGLADEFARMMSSFWLEACLAAAVLLAGGMLSLFLYRRGSMKAAGAESRISP
ncbi:MAG: hypothetical protein IKQ45_06045 [Clostridia bacterium]|nr:hypothetical protein [Clostridia bacterium]